MDAYIIQAMHGLVYGMLLFLVTSGLTLVFGMMGLNLPLPPGRPRNWSLRMALNSL